MLLHAFRKRTDGRPECICMRPSDDPQHRFPLLNGAGTISWTVAEEAYRGYVAKFGECQTLQRIAQRGGFSEAEMDDFCPSGWRHAD